MADQRRRSGSFMSDRQIARAALGRRLVTFRFLSSQVPHEVRGYVVGMDDYKWLVATAAPDGLVSTALVHKSVDLVLIDPRTTLAAEPQGIADEVTAVGRDFWSWCERTYQGRVSGNDN